MGSQRNTGAFIAGSVLGGIVGAVIALWKTPQSGPELRASLSGGNVEPANRRFSNPVLGFVEKATAPIVGVELGKLAKDDPQAADTAPVRASAADARPPGSVGETVAAASDSAEVTAPLGAIDRATGEDFPAAEPADEATHDSVEGSTAHAATTEDLTKPAEAPVKGSPGGDQSR